MGPFSRSHSPLQPQTMSQVKCMLRFHYSNFGAELNGQPIIASLRHIRRYGRYGGPTECIKCLSNGDCREHQFVNTMKHVLVPRLLANCRVFSCIIAGDRLHLAHAPALPTNNCHLDQ
jgi:hypothetical protein